MMQFYKNKTSQFTINKKDKLIFLSTHQFQELNQRYSTDGHFKHEFGLFFGTGKGRSTARQMRATGKRIDLRRNAILH